MRSSCTDQQKKMSCEYHYSAVCVAKDRKGGGCSQFLGRYESELILTL